MDESTSEPPKRRLLFVSKPPESEEDRQTFAADLTLRIWTELHPGDSGGRAGATGLASS